MRWHWTAVGMLGVAGCLGEVRGSGVSASETRDLTGFSVIEERTGVDVVVRAGDPGALVTCDDNLVDLIDTRVEGDTLVIGTPGILGMVPRVDCVVELTAPPLASIVDSGSGDLVLDGDWPGLSSVTLSGSGEVDVAGIDADHVDALLSGSGRIRLEGTADDATLRLTGSGVLDASDLLLRDAEVVLSGSGDLAVTATGEVDVTLSGSGDVTVGGGASVTEHVTGSGQVLTE